MLQIGHHDDGKKELCSHSIAIGSIDCLFDVTPNGALILSYDIISLSGCGATKEEALTDLRDQYNYVMKQLAEFGKKLNDDEYIKNNPDFIIEVDCFGEPIED